MKVLIIPSWYPTAENPIAGSFFQEQGEFLNNNGCSVKILLEEPQVKPSRFPKLKYKLATSYKRHLGFKSNTKNWISTPSIYTFGSEVINSWSDSQKCIIRARAYEWAMEQLIADGWRPDIIHAHSTNTAGIWAVHLGQKFNIPTVITEHSPFLLHNIGAFWRSKIFYALENATSVIAVSEHQKRCILMHDVNCNPYVIGNLVDERNFSINKRLSDNVTLRILTISYPEFIKDPETFFQGISDLIKSGFINIKVTIIGHDLQKKTPTPDTSAFELLAKKYSIADYCTFIPRVLRNEINNIVNEHDVFVSTSISETFGVAIREAMSAGIPVITTRSGGPEDVMSDVNGIKIPIKGYKELSNALKKIILKELVFDALKIRESVINECGTDAFLEKTLNVYHSTIKPESIS